MQCDICSSPGSGTIVPASQFSGAVRRGFNGILHCRLPIALSAEAKAHHAERWARSATSGDTSQSDWNVCSACMSALRPYLSPTAPKEEPTPASKPASTKKWWQFWK